MTETVPSEAGRRYEQERTRLALRILADKINEGLPIGEHLVEPGDLINRAAAPPPKPPGAGSA